MGLAITAYQKVTLKEAITMDALEKINWDHPLYDDDRYVLLYNLKTFKPRSDGLVEGFYKVGGKQLHFSMGPYSAYGTWREELARLVKTTPKQMWAGKGPKAFREIISFADNEGFLGPKTSGKLSIDFAKHRPSAVGFKSSLSWFLEAYGEWSRALTLAAGSGIVYFH